MTFLLDLQFTGTKAARKCVFSRAVVSDETELLSDAYVGMEPHRRFTVRDFELKQLIV